MREVWPTPERDLARLSPEATHPPQPQVSTQQRSLLWATPRPFSAGPPHCLAAHLLQAAADFVPSSSACFSSDTPDG